MREDIKKRIEAVRCGEVPVGYQRTKDIGIAPADWKVGQLSDVLHNEIRPVSKPNEPYWRLGIRSWAKGTFHAYVDDPKTVDMDELYVVRENDLVVNITFAWEHAIAIASKEDDGLLVSHRFPTYVFDGGNVPAYYRAVVSQRFFKDMLDHISPGGAGRNRVLNRKDFLALPCYVPPVTEQQKIADILATCDRVIELKQQLLEEKCRQKQWLMQKLLDPGSGVRLPGFQDSEWTTCTIKDVAKIKHGQSQHDIICDGGVYPILASGGEIGRTNTYLYNKPSVLIGRKGSIDKPVFMTTPFWTVDTLFYSEIHSNIDPLFLYYIFSSINWWKYNESTGVPSLSAKTIEEIQITCPKLMSEQLAISNLLQTADSEIDSVIYELEAWKQKKKALMQLLLTGLVRVNA